jgi:hypothetical protein
MRDDKLKRKKKNANINRERPVGFGEGNTRDSVKMKQFQYARVCVNLRVKPGKNRQVRTKTWPCYKVIGMWKYTRGHIIDVLIKESRNPFSFAMFLHRSQTTGFKLKLRGLSPRANYIDRATAAYRR